MPGLEATQSQHGGSAAVTGRLLVDAVEQQGQIQQGHSWHHPDVGVYGENMDFSAKE